MKTSFPLVGIVSGGVLLAASASASAQTYENETGGSARFYGQFSPTWLSFDDGEDTTDTLADNANSNTRLGFVITQPMGENELTLTFETALGLVQTSEISNDDIPDWIDWQRTDLRKFEAAYAGALGRISFGQGSMASDGVAELDVSGTTIAGYSAVSDVAGGFFFRDKDGILSDISISDTFQNLDGSRRFRLRYDTPSFSGFTGAVAYGQNVLDEDDDKDYYDLALRWEGMSGDFELAAAAGYGWADPDDGETQEKFAASTSLLHTPTGLNLAVSGGSNPDGGGYGYIKAGWIAKFLDVGTTAFSIDYYSGEDFETDGSNSDSLGVSVVQNFDDANFQIYMGWRNYDYDDTGGTYQDAQSLLIGARVRF